MRLKIRRKRGNQIGERRAQRREARTSKVKNCIGRFDQKSIAGGTVSIQI